MKNTLIFVTGSLLVQAALDAQKAFDIANHFIIFSALVDAGIKINLFVLRIVDVTIVYL